MKSEALPSFWAAYRSPDDSIRQQSHKNISSVVGQSFSPVIAFQMYQ